MTAEPIPAEWRDPRVVMPHLAELLGRWKVSLDQLEENLSVIDGSLEDLEEPDRTRLRDWLESVQGQLHELNLHVASRATAYQTVADELGKEAR